MIDSNHTGCTFTLKNIVSLFFSFLFCLKKLIFYSLVGHYYAYASLLIYYIFNFKFADHSGHTVIGLQIIVILSYSMVIYVTLSGSSMIL